MTATVDDIWLSACRRYGHRRQRISSGHTALLLSLHLRGAAHTSEIARRADAGQGNASVYLRRFELYGFVASEQLNEFGHQGGGWARVQWRITAAGRALAQALIDEERTARTPEVGWRPFWLTDKALAAVGPAREIDAVSRRGQERNWLLTPAAFAALDGSADEAVA